jgi:MFS family permease
MVDRNTKNRWIGLAAVNTASTLCQTVQIGALPPLVGLTLAEKGMDPATIGLFATAPWLAILVASRYVPAFLHVVGPSTSLALSALGSTAVIAAMAFTDDMAVFFVLNLLARLGLIVRWVTCDTWIVTIAPHEARGRAIGTHETLMGLGIALGPLVLSLTGTSGTLPFLACAALTALALPPLLVLGRWNQRHETVRDRRGSGRRVVRLLPIAMLGAFVAGYVETSSISLFAIYATDTGQNTGQDAVAATLLVSAFGFGGTLLQVPIGWMADGIGPHRGHRLCALIIFAGSVIVPATLAQPWLAAGMLFLWGGAAGGMNTLAVLEAGATVAARDLAAAMTSVAFCYTVGSMVGPSVSGAFMQYLSADGLMISAGLVSGGFVLASSLLTLKPAATS